jgi:hypothetical protein
MKAKRGRRGLTLLSLYPRCLIGVGGHATLQLLYFWKRYMLPIVQKARWASEFVLTVRENLAHYWTIQLVGSCYTDWAIPAATYKQILYKNIGLFLKTNTRFCSLNVNKHLQNRSLPIHIHIYESNVTYLDKVLVSQFPKHGK